MLARQVQLARDTSRRSMPIAAAELRIVEQAVEAAGGNVSEAARLLGISRTRIYRILRARD